MYICFKYSENTDILGGCETPKFSGGGCPQTPPMPLTSVQNLVLPMLCPSNGDVLATPLHQAGVETFGF